MEDGDNNSESEALWHCIGNQTQGVYETTGGKWFRVLGGDGEVNAHGDVADLSHGPDLSVTYVWTEALEVLDGDGEGGLSIYDRACTGERHQTFSTAFYAAVEQKNSGQPMKDAAPCWRRGAVPIQIQGPEDWLENGCHPGFLCKCQTTKMKRKTSPSLDTY
jgi:hypothetical protein